MRTTAMLHKKFSTYFAFASWGIAAFMAQPTMASGVAHFLINPLLLAAVIWLAHHEGMRG
jgi:hypothetical protein